MHEKDSTITHWKAFQTAHNSLTQHQAWYKNWHHQRISSLIHAFGLACFSLAAISLVVNNFIPLVAYAASKTWTTTADFSTWTHSSTRAANNHIELTATPSGNDIVTIKNAKLPTRRFASSVAWNPDTSKAYIFGGQDTDYIDQIVEYSPESDSISIKSAHLPTTRDYTSAVWDPGHKKFYIFGGRSLIGGSAPLFDDIVEYDPSTDSVTTKSAHLTVPLYSTSAVWDATQNKAYIFGGTDGDETDGDGSVDSDRIMEYNPSNDTLSLKSAKLPTARTATASIWDSANNKSYIFGGNNDLAGNINQILEYNPSNDTLSVKSATLNPENGGTKAIWDSTAGLVYLFGGTNNFGSSLDQIAQYNPSNDTFSERSSNLPSGRTVNGAIWNSGTQKGYLFGGADSGSFLDEIVEFARGQTYAGSGSATVIYTPVSGQTVDWQSASYNATTNGQTVTVQYTTNTNCSTGLTSNITTLSNSTSLCVKASLSSSSSSTTPTLDDVTITYATASSGGGGSGGTPTPTPTTGGGSGGLPTPTPIITQVQSCNATIKNLAIAVGIDQATVTFTTTTATRGSLYVYGDSRTSPPNDEKKKATNYTTNSTKSEETTSTRNHTLTVNGLTPTTKYYYTVLSNSSQECEHSFTTQTPPTPSPSPSPLITPTATASTIGTTGGGTESILDWLSKQKGLGLLGILSLLIGLLTLLTQGERTFTNLTSIFTHSPRWWNVLTWKKRKFTWGRVVSALTMEGIPQALVRILDTENYNKIIDQVVSDKEGQFGFYVPKGKYKAQVTHAGYTFPSQLRPDGYTGWAFPMGEEGVIQFDMPMDPVTVSKRSWQKVEAFLLKLELLRIPLLIFGSILSMINVVTQGISVITLFFLAYYAIMWAYELSRSKEARYALSVRNSQGEALGFAIVRLKDSQGRMVFTKATTPDEGRAFLFAPKGSYTLEIIPRAGTTKTQSKVMQINLEKGFLMRPLTITID